METLAQKAQRLGIQPQGTPVASSIQGETLLQKAQRLNIQPVAPKYNPDTIVAGDNAGQQVPDTARNTIGRMFIGGAVKFGNIIGSTMGASQGADQMGQQQAESQPLLNKALGTIRTAKAQGRDTSRIESAYRGASGAPAQQFEQNNPVLNATAEQVVGAGLETGASIAGFGSYGKGFFGLANSGRLAPKTVPTVASGLERLINGGSIFSKETAASSAVGAGTGLAYDTSSYLQNPEQGFSPTGTALGAFLPPVAELGFKGLGKLVNGVSGVVTKEGRVNSVIANRTKELDKLEGSYPSIRAVTDKAKSKGTDVKKILAETDYLHEAVDNQGTIHTKQEGGATDRFINEHIKPKERSEERV